MEDAFAVVDQVVDVVVEDLEEREDCWVGAGWFEGYGRVFEWDVILLGLVFLFLPDFM